MLKKIVSGAQTGVDRAALDLAREYGFETGGYVPAGRLAEDGRIPDKYTGLNETVSGEPAERTKLNVRHSDATLVLTHGRPAAGTKLTIDIAHDLGKPVCHIDLDAVDLDAALEVVRGWLSGTRCQTLNVAGPRSSEDAAIYRAAKQFLSRVVEDEKALAQLSKG